MLPTLRPGDMVLVAFGARQPQPGDLLVFRRGAEIITHRLLEILSTGAGQATYLTKGDRLWQADAPVAQEQVIGLVTEIRHSGVRLALETPAWRRRNRLATGWMRAQYRRMRFWQSRGLPAVGIQWLGRLENLAAIAYLALLDFWLKLNKGPGGQ
jgi:hypothetical protein